MHITIALNLNELETICAGTSGELSDDSCFLNTLNGSTDRYGTAKIIFGGKADEISSAWAKVGVKCRDNLFFGNTYSINGTFVSQQKAREYAMEQVGNTITQSDWDW